MLTTARQRAAVVAAIDLRSINLRIIWPSPWEKVGRVFIVWASKILSYQGFLSRIGEPAKVWPPTIGDMKKGGDKPPISR
jgi:hypothetical protein